MFPRQQPLENFSVPGAHVVVDEDVESRVDGLEDNDKTSCHDKNMSELSINGKFGLQGHGDKQSRDRREAGNVQRGDHHYHLGNPHVRVGQVVSLSCRRRLLSPLVFLVQFERQYHRANNDDQKSADWNRDIVDGEGQLSNFQRILCVHETNQSSVSVVAELQPKPRDQVKWSHADDEDDVNTDYDEDHSLWSDNIFDLLKNSIIRK